MPITYRNFRFGVFEYFNRRWREKDGSFSVSTTFLSGLIAGMAEAVVAVTPMEVIKMKVINDMYKPRPRYRGMFHAARDIIKRNGSVKLNGEITYYIHIS